MPEEGSGSLQREVRIGRAPKNPHAAHEWGIRRASLKRLPFVAGQAGLRPALFARLRRAGRRQVAVGTHARVGSWEAATHPLLRMEPPAI